MATQIVQTPMSVDDQGMSLADRKAHEAASYVRPPATVRSVTRYGILLARVAELTMKDRLTPAEFDGLADAQAELTRLHEQLEAAGRLDLVGGA